MKIVLNSLLMYVNFHYFRSKIYETMETPRKSLGKYWMLFFASLVGAALIWIFIPQMITLSLPFICTFFAKAMDIM